MLQSVTASVVVSATSTMGGLKPPIISPPIELHVPSWGKTTPIRYVDLKLAECLDLPCVFKYLGLTNSERNLPHSVILALQKAVQDEKSGLLLVDGTPNVFYLEQHSKPFVSVRWKEKKEKGHGNWQHLPHKDFAGVSSDFLRLFVRG